MHTQSYPFFACSLAFSPLLPYFFFVLLFHSEILQFVLYLLFCVVLSVSVFGVRFVERLFLWTVEFQPTNIRDGRRYKQKWKIKCVYVFIAYSGVYSQKISNKIVEPNEAQRNDHHHHHNFFFHITRLAHRVLYQLIFLYSLSLSQFVCVC